MCDAKECSNSDEILGYHFGVSYFAAYLRINVE